MVRTNLYLPTYQKEKLEQLALEENTSASEMARRAIDAYLIWRDPNYSPHPKLQSRNGDSSPV
ncbi:ribbon-helix-helix domain-containing protein [Dictyobacter formicarum]|nr:CopG family transcriptional regulator [Dictyobacter formicarum]